MGEICRRVEGAPAAAKLSETRWIVRRAPRLARRALTLSPSARGCAVLAAMSATWEAVAAPPSSPDDKATPSAAVRFRVHNRRASRPSWKWKQKDIPSHGAIQPRGTLVRGKSWARRYIDTVRSSVGQLCGKVRVVWGGGGGAQNRDRGSEG